MTHSPASRKRTRTFDESARRASLRADRHAARSTLRDVSSLPRVRTCGLFAAPRPDGASRYVSVKVTETPTGPRAGISGVSVCGNTWSCPCCSERIQSERNAEVRAALARARALGLVVAFVTFTVRHRRSHALVSVWEAVAGAWRAATSGAGPAWAQERDDFGMVGYLRLTEVTHGDENGWHVHIHALVFLDPAGRDHAVTAPLVGPMLPARPRRVPEVVEGFDPRAWRGVPFAPGVAFHAVRSARENGPATLPVSTDPLENVAEQFSQLHPRRPLVPAYDSNGRARTYKASATRCETAQRLLGVAEPVSRAWVAHVNDAYDENRRRRSRSGNPAVSSSVAGEAAAVRGFYLRDVERLAGSMFDRWTKHLKGLRCRVGNLCSRKACRESGVPCKRELGFTPGEKHGLDVRLVTDDGAFLADYFAKNRYSIKNETSAAFDVTGSHAKQARHGNVTPFGILGRIVGAPEVVNSATGELTRTPARGDRRLWQEWERGSKGRRQLVWSNGLRDLLGLAEERTDEEIAASDLDGVEVLAMPQAGYLRIERAGLVPQLLALVETAGGSTARLWLESRGVVSWVPAPPGALGAA